MKFQPEGNLARKAALRAILKLRLRESDKVEALCDENGKEIFVTEALSLANWVQIFLKKIEPGYGPPGNEYKVYVSEVEKIDEEAPLEGRNINTGDLFAGVELKELEFFEEPDRKGIRGAAYITHQNHELAKELVDLLGLETYHDEEEIKWKFELTYKEPEQK
ncbi:MAG: hypothetical protein V5A57_02205 [Candidatus Paceibacterota bacterium]